MVSPLGGQEDMTYHKNQFPYGSQSRSTFTKASRATRNEYSEQYLSK